MVEGTRLESVRCGNVSGGSNPPLSAIKTDTLSGVCFYVEAEAENEKIRGNQTVDFFRSSYERVILERIQACPMVAASNLTPQAAVSLPFGRLFLC